MSFNMMSPESYPTMFPFSAAAWHNSTGLPALSYGPVILGRARYLYPLSASAKRRYPRCLGEKRANSFTIDAILGLQEAKARNALVKDELNDAAYDFAPRQQQLSSSGSTLPSHRHPTVFSPKLPATHMAFVPWSTYHAPLPEGDPAVRRPRLKGSEETGKGGYDHKNRDEDFKFLGSFGEMDSCRKILNRDESCNGLKRSAPLGWTDEVLLVEQTNKPKRVRTIFTQDQLDRLETEFARQQYMVGTERLYLASQLDLSESQVKVWFQNRRIKWRKQNLEQQQEKLAKYRALRNKESIERQFENDPELNNRCKASYVNDDNEDVIKDTQDEEKSNVLTLKQPGEKIW